MPNSIIVKDRNGKVRECSTVEGLNISFEKGDNNKVTITEPYSFENSGIVVNGSENIFEIEGSSNVIRLTCIISGNSNSVRIGQNSEIRNVKIVMSSIADGRKLDIGKNICYIGGLLNIVSNNNALIIGDNCMFSYSTTISTEDGHPIYDIYTKKILNKGDKIIIGNNVWLGYNCTICKKVSIADNVMVGACSIVTKSITENNCIAVGEPAKVIKRGVGFNKMTIDSYLRNCGKL